MSSARFDDPEMGVTMHRVQDLIGGEVVAMVIRRGEVFTVAIPSDVYRDGVIDTLRHLDWPAILAD